MFGGSNSGNGSGGGGGGNDLNSVLQATPDGQSASLTLSNPGIDILGGISFRGDTFGINGLSTPTTQATATIASPAAPGNIDNGDHSYVYTYIGSSDGETIPGPSSSKVTITNNAVNGQATITVPPSTVDPGIAQAWVYRDFNSDGKYYFVSGVTPGVPFTDNVDNASLGQAAPDVGTSGNLDIDNDLLVGGAAQITGNLTAAAGNVSLTDTTSTLSSLQLRPHVGADAFGLKIAPVTNAGPDYTGNLSEWYKFKGNVQTLVRTIDDNGVLSGVVQVLATVSGINLKTTAVTSLYTVPAGKTAIITDVLLQATAVSNVTVDPSITCGDNSPSFFNWGNAPLPGFVSSGQLLSFLNCAWNYNQISSASQVNTFNNIASSGNTFSMSVGGATATTLTVTVHVLGYLV